MEFYTKNKKVVWHCISKHGNKYCPDSKGIHEAVLKKPLSKYVMKCDDGGWTRVSVVR